MGIAFCLPGVAAAQSAQRPGKPVVIGYLAAAGRAAFTANFRGLEHGLRELGYRAGQNLRLEARYADGRLERLAGFAQELAGLGAEVLVTAGSHVTRVTRRETRDVPIVMAYAGDPVGGGLVDSLARPGGRITGLTTLSPQLAGKRLELLREVLPGAKRIGVVWNPEVPERVLQFKETQVAAAKLGMPLQSFEARSMEDIDMALKSVSAAPVDAVIIFSDALLQANQKRIVTVIRDHRLPSLYQLREAAELGGLLSYGPSFSDLHRRAATYVDRIVRGAKPGDLPIEQPTKFELIVNVKAAQALGITIPQAVLLRADGVIQ